MQKLLLTLIALSISSCSPFPTLNPKGDPPQTIERCGIFLEEVGADIYAGHCRCALWEVSFKNLGPIEEGVNYPLSYCNKGVVFNTDNSYYELNVWLKKLMIFGAGYEKERSKRRK